MERIENCNLADIQPLIPPRAVKNRLPLSDTAARVVVETRGAIRDLLHGRDPHRLLAVVGPCSIHDARGAVDYARRLKPVADATRHELLILMRTYFEKPRTTVGWKGLINDPHLDGSCDVPAGLTLAREILLAINEIGVPCGTELLDPITPQYIADLLSWAAIGARTTESQTHREMASGLSMPVGFKNPTNGSLRVALNAMVSARHPHAFLGIDAGGRTSVVRTLGNPDRHIVLRGGGGKPNYGPDEVEAAAALVASEDIARPLMIDCSHDNSHKDHRRQGQVCREVLRQVRDGQAAINGFLLESNLHPGSQTWVKDRPLAYGVSITDACIGWDETEELLCEMAQAVKERTGRGRVPALVGS